MCSRRALTTERHSQALVCKLTQRLRLCRPHPGRPPNSGALPSGRPGPGPGGGLGQRGARGPGRGWRTVCPDVPAGEKRAPPPPPRCREPPPGDQRGLCPGAPDRRSASWELLQQRTLKRRPKPGAEEAAGRAPRGLPRELWTTGQSWARGSTGHSKAVQGGGGAGLSEQGGCGAWPGGKPGLRHKQGLKLRRDGGQLGPRPPHSCWAVQGRARRAAGAQSSPLPSGPRTQALGPGSVAARIGRRHGSATSCSGGRTKRSGPLRPPPTRTGPGCSEQTAPTRGGGGGEAPFPWLCPVWRQHGCTWEGRPRGAQDGPD